MFFDKFRKFEFVNIIQGSYNINFILKEKLTGAFWIGKISKSLKSHNVDFIDLDNRAILAYRLAKKLRTCLPATKLINYKQIKYSPLFNEFLKLVQPGKVVMTDKLLITKFLGITLPNFAKFSQIEKIKNLKQVLNNFVFNLWIGNYDKKNDDYVVDNNLFCYSIDYNLLGPGFHANNSLALGAYAQSYNINDIEDTGWAIAPLFKDEIRTKQYRVDFFNSEIEKIEGLLEREIQSAFTGLNFFKHSSTENLNSKFIKFLLDRKNKIREAINKWCNEDYPRGDRPKPKSNPSSRA